MSHRVSWSLALLVPEANCRLWFSKDELWILLISLLQLLIRTFRLNILPLFWCPILYKWNLFTLDILFQQSFCNVQLFLETQNVIGIWDTECAYHSRVWLDRCEITVLFHISITFDIIHWTKYILFVTKNPMPK